MKTKPTPSATQSTRGGLAAVPPIYSLAAARLLDDLDGIYSEIRERTVFFPAPLAAALNGGLGAELALLKAPGGTGKTDLVLEIAISMATSRKVVVSSREISKQACMRRILSCMSCMMEGGTALTEEDIALRAEASGEKAEAIGKLLARAADVCANIILVDDADMAGDEDGHTVEALSEAVRAMHSQLGTAPALIVDYAQLITTRNRAFSQTDVLDRVSHGLAAIAHREKTPVVAIVTTGKDGTMRGSSQLQFDPDIILDLKAQENADGSRTSTIAIEKNRNGPSGREVRLAYWPAYHFFGPYEAPE